MREQLAGVSRAGRRARTPESRFVHRRPFALKCAAPLTVWVVTVEIDADAVFEVHVFSSFAVAKQAAAGLALAELDEEDSVDRTDVDACIEAAQREARCHGRRRSVGVRLRRGLRRQRCLFSRTSAAHRGESGAGADSHHKQGAAHDPQRVCRRAREHGPEPTAASVGSADP